ncbi:MAG: VOC family protein [Methanosarcinaceae archaeon]|nr:VOC family protein [Methanosarcinaceae archaeon]
MPTIVHIDVPSDDLERARKFYSDLFGWKFEHPPGMTDYYLFETKGLNGDDGLRGGLGMRGAPDQRMTAYIGVSSVDEYCERIGNAGGKILNKMPVPGWGYLAICLDTENNIFGIWEDNGNAK